MKTILYVKGSDRLPSVQKCAGFEHGAKAHGWRVHAVTLPPSRPPELRKLVAFWKADAFVLDCGSFAKQPDLRALRGTPSVFLTCRAATEKRFTVCEDLRLTAECAARELLQLGYRHYAFVPFPRTRYWSEERARHFREIVRLNGCDCAAFASDDRAATSVWKSRLRRWLRELPRPCGVFAANDEVAAVVRDLCAAEGLSIPDEIAIVGVDNDESICTSESPQLSSVLADNEQMGFLAAQLLAAQFRNPRAKPKACIVPPLLAVRRDSTRQKPQTDERIAKALALIREKACEKLRARDVLKTLGGSRRSAETRFRDATGRSILEEIQRVRVARAKVLLHDSRHSVKDVAALCGYASETAFRKVYVSVAGRPPRRFGNPG